MHRELFPFSGFGMLNWVISTVQKGSVFVKVHMETFWCYPDFSTTCKSNQNSAKFPKILKKGEMPNDISGQTTFENKLSTLVSTHIFAN